MTEITATLDNQDVGVLEIFDVKTSVETVEYNHENHEDNENEDSQDDWPLHIDISDDQDMLILNPRQSRLMNSTKLTILQPQVQDLGKVQGEQGLMHNKP